MGSSSGRLQAIAAIAARPATESPRVNFKETPAKSLYAANVFSDEVMRARLPENVYKALRNTIKKGVRTRSIHRRRRRVGDEGLGDRERGDALHPLVPADDRPDGREARLVPVADRCRDGGRRVRRQGAGARRARRLELPLRRHPRHVRGARLHRLGPDEPGVHPREPQRHDALYPDRLLLVDGRGARQEDPAARARWRRSRSRRCGCSSSSARTRRRSNRPLAPSRNTS